MKSTAKPDSETKAGASKAYGAVAATCIWAPSKVHRRSNRKLVLLSGLLSKVFPCYPKEPFFFSSTGSLNPQTRKPPISHPSTFQTEISASPWEADNSDRQHALWRYIRTDPRSQTGHLLAVWPWTSDLTFWSLGPHLQLALSSPICWEVWKKEYKYHY